MKIEIEDPDEGIADAGYYTIRYFNDHGEMDVEANISAEIFEEYLGDTDGLRGIAELIDRIEEEPEPVV